MPLQKTIQISNLKEIIRFEKYIRKRGILLAVSLFSWLTPMCTY